MELDIPELVKMTKALVFPFTFLLILFFFRKELKSLIWGLTYHLDKRYALVELPKQIDKLLNEANAANLQPSKKEDQAEEEILYVLPENRFNMLTRLSPNSAILEAWVDVEMAIYKFARFRNLPDTLSYADIIAKLSGEGTLTATEVSLLDQAQYIRDQIIEKTNIGFSAMHAGKYRNVILRIVEQMKVTPSD